MLFLSNYPEAQRNGSKVIYTRHRSMSLDDTVEVNPPYIVPFNHAFKSKIQSNLCLQIDESRW